MGNVRVKYRTYTVECDRLDVDTDTSTALFSGHLVMHSDAGDTVRGGPNGTLLTSTELDGINHPQIAQHIKKIKSGA